MNNHLRKALLPIALVSLPLSAAAELAPLEDEFLGASFDLGAGSGPVL